MKNFVEKVCAFVLWAFLSIGGTVMVVWIIWGVATHPGMYYEPFDCFFLAWLAIAGTLFAIEGLVKLATEINIWIMLKKSEVGD